MNMREEEPPISIRESTRDDVPAITRCLGEAFEAYREAYTPGAFADTVLNAHALERRMEKMCVLVAATISGQIVGTIAYEIVNADEGHIRGMAVLPSTQSSGVARQLLNTVEAKLRAERCLRITLDTTAPLIRAIHFYERNGFRRSGRVTDFFGMDLVEFVKPLSA
jgi:ribosomal protein S18 acetylase RimI-like enzyme